jgi:hypothetical protein
MKPQSLQRKTLCSPKEYHFKEITEKMTSGVLEVPGTSQKNITPENAIDPSADNFHVVLVKDGMKRLITLRAQRGWKSSFLIAFRLDKYSACSVV